MLKYLIFFMFFTTNLFAQSSNEIILNSTNTISLNDYVNSESAQKVFLDARALDLAYPNAGPIYFVIYSGGGSINAGIEMINNLKTIKRPIHTVTIFAASMAFHTVQALGKRYILPFGTLMQHKAKGGFQGEFPDGNIDAEFAYWSARIKTLDAVTAKRTGRPQAELARKFDNSYWCNAQECVTEKFADITATAKCDASLNGTYKVFEKKFVEMAGGAMGRLVVTTTYSMCPLMTAALDVKVSVTDLKGNEISSEGLKSKFKSEIEYLMQSKSKIIPRMWFDIEPLR